MTRYLVLHSFHKFSQLSMHRLQRLKKMNPHTTIVPFFGVPQRIFFPIIVELPSARFLNWTFLRFNHLCEFSLAINKIVESFRRKTEFDIARGVTHKNGLNLFLDFTPMGYFNLDLAIMRWFSSKGKDFDFDFIVFFEYDMFATKTIESLYERYTVYDAAFINYCEAPSSWYWYRNPRGALESVRSWLKDRGLNATLYACLFCGNIVSRQVLEKLEKMQLPYSHCEMRWPTIITNLGFSCGRLDFPMADRYKRPVSRSFIEKNPSYGIFHPVYEDFDY